MAGGKRGESVMQVKQNSPAADRAVGSVKHKIKAPDTRRGEEEKLFTYILARKMR